VSGSTAFSSHGFLLLLLDAAILAVVVLRPFKRTYDESDKGSGNVVVMRPPLKPSYRRCAVFFLTSIAVSAVIVGLKTPSLADIYHNLVTQLLLSVIPDPAVVDGYANSLLPVFQVSVLSFGVAFAVAFRASFGRRLMILLNVAFFLLVSAVVDAFFGIFVIKTGFPLGPTPVVNLLVQYTIAGVVVCRVALTSFELPRKTQLPIGRYKPTDLIGDAVVIICVVTALAIVMAGAIYLESKFGGSPLLAAGIAYACPPYVFLLITVFLGLVRLVHHRKVNPSSERPPVEVIIPAFNEELNIADLLGTIDVAAGRYEGPVRVVMCDDGSTDSTYELASTAIAGFQHATGEVIKGSHSGKSGALNTALSACRADFVYRVDADCLVHPECFLYSVPHFLADPRVGMVGAFTLPKEPYTTWIDRMRMFEMITGFGMVRPAVDVVDGITCIPGTFTAFRRDAAAAVGGFVEGMYGEDLDFTLAVARVGYRVVVDTRVRSYEDVPNTQRQLRIQRTRWNRGGTMAFGRYVPGATGFAGSRYWFFMTRSSFKRFLTPLHLTTLLYVLTLAVLDPTSHVNLIRVLFVLFFRELPALVQLMACCVYYGVARRLGWLPVRYAFILLKHYYGLEAFLGFNARPVLTERLREALRPAPRRPVPREVEVAESYAG
jgi:cellulose synthase/poly-beta-1,6-N-acetylglucosamine synthase-like glycosyltransferase